MVFTCKGLKKDYGCPSFKKSNNEQDRELSHLRTVQWEMECGTP